MNRFFSVNEDFKFKRDNLELNINNSIYLQFKGIDNKHPYNLLLVLSLCDEIEFDFKMQNSINRVAENNIDKIVIWTRQNINPDIIYRGQTLNIHLIYAIIQKIKYIRSINAKKTKDRISWVSSYN